jgi:para-aminobenzoate synthetase component 1
MHQGMFSGRNFLFTRNNHHAQGFDDALYLLSPKQDAFLPRSVVYIPYSHKEVILQHREESFGYYPVLEELPSSDFPETTLNETALPEITFTSPTTKQEYLYRVASLKQHIQRGDIYEINFCLEFRAKNVHLNPFDIFHRLNAIGCPPYAALAKLDHLWIISASPELFLQKTGKELITKPIKGTARRSHENSEDEKLKEQLRNSKKEQTENVMIVDVARNDFSIIAEKGSVKVPLLFDVESFNTVHQLVSTISCNIKPGIDFKQIIEANFPMPSMTGAPKIRAMALIDSHEQFSRSAYSGTLGYIKPNGDFTLSVLIRTLVYDEKTKTLSFAVGSAITHLCDPEEEYKECLLKAQGMLKAVNGVIAQ